MFRTQDTHRLDTTRHRLTSGDGGLLRLTHRASRGLVVSSASPAGAGWRRAAAGSGGPYLGSARGSREDRPRGTASSGRLRDAVAVAVAAPLSFPGLGGGGDAVTFLAFLAMQTWRLHAAATDHLAVAVARPSPGRTGVWAARPPSPLPGLVRWSWRVARGAQGRGRTRRFRSDSIPGRHWNAVALPCPACCLHAAGSGRARDAGQCRATAAPPPSAPPHLHRLTACQRLRHGQPVMTQPAPAPASSTPPSPSVPWPGAAKLFSGTVHAGRESRARPSPHGSFHPCFCQTHKGCHLAVCLTALHCCNRKNTGLMLIAALPLSTLLINAPPPPSDKGQTYPFTM